MGRMIALRAILTFPKIVSEYKFPRFKIRRIVYRRIRRVFLCAEDCFLRLFRLGPCLLDKMFPRFPFFPFSGHLSTLRAADFMPLAPLNAPPIRRNGIPLFLIAFSFRLVPVSAAVWPLFLSRLRSVLTFLQIPSWLLPRFSSDAFRGQTCLAADWNFRHHAFLRAMYIL